MKDLTQFDEWRTSTESLWGHNGGDKCGAFIICSPIDRANIRVVATNGDGWDHVSVSRKNRCPNWIEMEHVKRMFFHDHETAMQLHMPPSKHINMHPYCLHLWRPHLPIQIPVPPAIFV